jgi:hypothetical protein
MLPYYFTMFFGQHKWGKEIILGESKTMVSDIDS